MGLLNFLGGAAGAGADILQRERESAVRLQERNAGADYDAKLREKQVRTEAELRKQYEREKIAYENSPEYLAMTAATEETKATNALNTRGKLAPKAGEVAKAEFEAGAPVRKAEAAEKLVLWKTEYGAKTAVELQAEIDKLNNPDYLKGKAKEAAAGRDPNSAALARVQLAAASLALKEKEAEAKIPPAVKLRVEPIRDQMKTIAGAIAKAQGENMFDPESDNAKSLFKQYADAQKQLDALLSPYYGDKMPKAGAPEAPAEPAVKYDAKGNAYVKGPDGKPMLKSSADRAATSDVPAQSQKPQTQQFNEAGYVDVQGTIDGAKRGDKKALELLKKMIARGETNPRQRAEIGNLLSK